MAGKHTGGGDSGDGEEKGDNVISLPFSFTPAKRTRQPNGMKTPRHRDGDKKLARQGIIEPTGVAPIAPTPAAARGDDASVVREIPVVDPATVPPHTPTPQTKSLAMVARLAEIEDEELARMIGVDLRTLYAYYREDMLLGDKRITASIVGNLARIAQGSGQGAVTAAIYMTKAVLGWRDGRETQATLKQRAKEAAAAADAAAQPAEPSIFVFDIGEKGKGRSA